MGRAARVHLTIAGRVVAVAPYTIADLYRAAPFLTRMSVHEAGDAVGLAVVAEAVLGFLAIGAARDDPSMTAERLGDLLTIGEAVMLRPALHQVLTLSGVKLASSGGASEGKAAAFEDQLDRTVMELVAAGVEGGSLSAIEERWTLADVDRLHQVWRERGPPLHVAAAIISAALGNKLTHDGPAKASGTDDPLRELGDIPVVPVARPRLGLPVATSAG